MYQKEFNNLIRQSLPSSLLMYGENAYLIELYIKIYIQKTEAKESMLSLYYEDWDFVRAKAFLSQSSLFGGTNLLLVQSHKKIPKKELDILIGLVNKNSDNYFIFYYQGLAKDAKSMQNAFTSKNKAVWVRFFEININEGVRLLSQKAQKIHLEIDSYALSHLLNILNNDIALCANELDKLAILNMKITSKDIDKLVYSSSSVATNDLLIDLFEKKSIKETIQKVLEMGEDVFSILRATQYFVTQLFLYHSYIQLHGNLDSQAILGFKLPKEVENRYYKLATNITAQSISNILEYLLDREILIKKSSPIQREALIFTTLLEIGKL